MRGKLISCQVLSSVHTMRWIVSVPAACVTVLAAIHCEARGLPGVHPRLSYPQHVFRVVLIMFPTAYLTKASACVLVRHTRLVVASANLVSWQRVAWCVASEKAVFMSRMSGVWEVVGTCLVALTPVHGLTLQV